GGDGPSPTCLFRSRAVPSDLGARPGRTGRTARLVNIHTIFTTLSGAVFSERQYPMSTRTTTKLIGLAAAMLVFLAFAPAASAERIGPHPAGGQSVAVFAPQFSPDRADHFGMGAGPQPVQVATLAGSDSGGFDWADAAIGAGVALLVMVAAGFGAPRI